MKNLYTVLSILINLSRVFEKLIKRYIKMLLNLAEDKLNEIRNYRLPALNEIPDVGLYLNQTASFVNKYLEPFSGFALTESMISNYVKKKLIDNPVKKQYSRETIAYLLIIALSKSVASLDNLQSLMQRQKEKYSIEQAYTFFKDEFEYMLSHVFNIENNKTEPEINGSVEAELLRSIIVTIAHKIYIDMAFSNNSL